MYSQREAGRDARQRSGFHAWPESRAAVVRALERDAHTISQWARAFAEGGPKALVFEQTGGSPALDVAQRGELPVVRLWRILMTSTRCALAVPSRCWGAWSRRRPLWAPSCGVSAGVMCAIWIG